MNGLEWFHLEEIEEDEIYEVAGKNAPWSLSDGGTDDSIIIFNPKPLLTNIIFFSFNAILSLKVNGTKNK